jgi:ArsR family transcriptional regulator
MTRDELDPSARRLWLLVREQVGTSPAAAQDQRRFQTALAARRRKSEDFFSSSAGQWDRVRDDLFGDRFHLAAIAALLQRDWVVGDLGCGTGQVSAALAPFVDRVIAVDASAAMLQAAKRRLSGLDNIDLRRGELEALPIDDGRLDAATLMLVLHHVPEPERALADVARVLKPGGPVLIVDMLPHDREQYRQQMGHAWLGFSDGRAGERSRTLCRNRTQPDAATKARRPGDSSKDTNDIEECAWRQQLKSVTPSPPRRLLAASRSRSRTSRRPNSAAKRSVSPSRKCPA